MSLLHASAATDRRTSGSRTARGACPSGHLAVAEFRKHRIKALGRAANGHEAYLAIIAEGVPDSQVIALLLDCVPGIATDDWLAEPPPLAEMNPAPGEIIWSTLFPADVSSVILEY